MIKQVAPLWLKGSCYPVSPGSRRGLSTGRPAAGLPFYPDAMGIGGVRLKEEYSDMNLKDKVAIITGASSGVGAAVARNLHEAGVKLVLTARRADRLEKLSSELKETVFIAGEITEVDLPQRLLDKALKTFGRCDIVLNNAGMIEVGSIPEINIDKVCQMVRVNVEAAYRVAYVAVKYFLSQNHGHLINTSSVLGTKIRPMAGAYAGTKFALEALSEALRVELARTNVKISCIQPGLILTELHRDYKVHPKDSLNIPRPLQPEEVARCVRFILEQPDHVRIPQIMILPKDQEI